MSRPGRNQTNVPSPPCGTAQAPGPASQSRGRGANPFGHFEAKWSCVLSRCAALPTAEKPPTCVKVMAAVQKPAFIQGLGDKFTAAASKTKPSWYQVSEKDQMIPPELERQMAKHIGAKTISLPTSHASLVSQPKAIADLIIEAANAIIK